MFLKNEVITNLVSKHKAITNKGGQDWSHMLAYECLRLLGSPLSLFLKVLVKVSLALHRFLTALMPRKQQTKQ